MKKENKTKNMARMILILSAIMLSVFWVLEQKYHNVMIFSLLVAFFEASMVGGIADLFAVHVLFKKPFGLKIPHTEIIPKNKDRIGQALSDFFRDNFLSEAYVKENINKYVISEKIGLLIQSRKLYLTNRLIRLLICGLKAFDYDLVKNFMSIKSEELFRNADFKAYMIALLNDLQNKKHHYEMVNYILIQLYGWLENPVNNEKVNRWIESAIKSDGNGGTSLMGSIKSAFVGNQDLAPMVKQLVIKLNSPDGEKIREEINKAFTGLIIEIEKSTVIDQAISNLKENIIKNENIKNCIEIIVFEITNWINNDLYSTDSKIRAYVSNQIDSLAYNLLHNKIWIDYIQLKSNQFLPKIIIENGNKIDQYIVQYIKKLDANEVSRLIEEKVGSDLQYIRINGSLVGGIVGLTIFLVKLGLSSLFFL